MGPNLVERLNGLLDALPRESVHLGARRVPAFRCAGVVGCHLALLTALVTGVRAGVPLLDVVGLSAVAALSFFGWALLRQAVTHRESLVLLEHLWVAFGCVAVYLWAAGSPLRPGLDVLAVAVCVFLAFGRVGCLLVGCCHGHPAVVGVVYPAGSAVRSDRLRSVRLFPLPLVESAALLGIAGVGLVLAGTRPGAATQWVLASYAVVRFGTEALRGDARPTLAGVPVARVLAVVQLLAAVGLDSAWYGGRAGQGYAVTGAVLAAVLLAGVRVARRRRDPLTASGHLDELWSQVRALGVVAPPSGRPPATSVTSQDVTLAASWTDDGLHVSLSHPHRALPDLPHGLGLVPVAARRAATHVVVPTARLRPALAGTAREPGPNGRVRDYPAQGRSVDGSRTAGAGVSGYFGGRPGS